MKKVCHANKTKPCIYHLFLCIGHAWADSCAVTSPQDAFDLADVIFTGHAKSVTFTTPRHADGIKPPVPEGCGDKTISFDVLDTWKGEPSRTLSILSEDSCLGLGGHFDIGHRYLVYAKKNGETYTSSICGRTHDVEDSYTHPVYEDEIKQLKSFAGDPARIAYSQQKQDWAAKGCTFPVKYLLWIARDRARLLAKKTFDDVPNNAIRSDCIDGNFIVTFPGQVVVKLNGKNAKWLNPPHTP